LIQPEVRFDVSLPPLERPLVHVGNGGYAGESLDAQGRLATARRALARGFAVAQTNSGHDAAVEPLGTSPAVRRSFLDYAFRAVHVTAATAKKIVGTYYQGRSAAFVFRRLLDRAAAKALISAPALSRRLRRHRRRRSRAELSGTMIGYRRCSAP
jgi:feruloyl esterase